MIPNQQNQKERKTEIASKRKKVNVIIPLIVMFLLICIIAICVVGAPFGRPTETAELNKDVEQEEEHISAAVDIAATTIGTNTKATFTVSTGEIHIYNSSTSGADATMSKSSWNTFLKKIITADGNLNAVKTITFDNVVYAPADSSNLFSPIISDVRYPLYELTTINNLNYLNLYKATSVNYMFYKCSGLKRIDRLFFNGNNVCTSAEYMFSDCYNLLSVDSDARFTSLQNADYIFKNCSSLKEVNLSNWSSPQGTSFFSAFRGCSSIEKLDFSNVRRTYFNEQVYFRILFVFGRVSSEKYFLGRMDRGVLEFESTTFYRLWCY